MWRTEKCGYNKHLVCETIGGNRRQRIGRITVGILHVRVASFKKWDGMGWERLGTPLPGILSYHLFWGDFGPSKGLCSKAIRKGSSVFGPKNLCSLQGCQIPGLGMNGEPWGNHVSSTRDAFLEICGLSIWAAGDGLDQGWGKGPRGDLSPWAQQGISLD